MSIATLVQLKAFLGIVDTDEDQVLTYLLSAANDQVTKYLGYDPVLSVITETRSGNDRYAMVLAHPFPVAIQSLTINGRVMSQRNDVNAGGWVFDGQKLWMTGSDRFYRGIGNVEVTYSAGFNPMSGALTQGVIDLVAHRREELKRRGISSKSLAGESVSFIHAAMPETIRGYLDAYRKVIYL